MRKKYLLQLALLAIFAAGTMPGCAKKPAPETVSPTGPATVGSPTEAGKAGGEQEGVRETRISEAPIAGEGTNGQGESPVREMTAQSTPELRRILFDYDQYVLSPEARQILAANAEFMRNRPQSTFVIEGHSDERGSDEYNLALGERRAQAARDYLISLGIAGTRLSIISYGEERPLQSGSGEEAWSQNRRAEFLLR